MDSYNYHGWLNSDKFWKRAFAVFGYYTVIQVPLALVLAILLSIAGL